MNFINNLRAFSVAFWFGAAVFFSFAVAPSAFAVLPARELAGLVVNRTLAIVNFAGLIISLIVFLTSFLPRINFGKSRIWLERALLLIMTAACGVGQFVIAARLQALRQSIGKPIDLVAADDAARLAFNDLHGYSVIVLTVAMISAMIVFFLLLRSSNKNLESL